MVEHSEEHDSQVRFHVVKVYLAGIGWHTGHHVQPDGACHPGRVVQAAHASDEGGPRLKH